MSPIKVINYIGEHQTMIYAAEELKAYLERVSGDKVSLSSYKSYEPGKEGLWLGSAEDFPGIQAPEVDDPLFDDAIYVNVSGWEGIIAGVNPRSVLLAVYRYLTELGCRWVRPGADGEFIPKVSLPQTRVSLSEAPSYRHRGICIEGALRYENVRDIIEWAPRVGLNGYYIQFREAYIFFHRWYNHLNNPLKEPEPFSIEDAKGFVDMAVQEILKRSLIYHGVGHGWTCEPFGLPGLGWDPVDIDVPPEVSQYLALLDGERKLFRDITLSTNLCYSNPKVREIVTREIADYAEAHPEVDILHFWLADGSNNQCECENCQKSFPSDFYVQMLNEVDKLLTERGLATKIVFLIYVDLLWAPEKERINNPERFILMFAPITRTYSKPFTLTKELPEIPEYKRNKLVFPADVEANIAFLRSWQEIFQGDSFDYDYHYMWDHYTDPGYVEITKVLYEDIKGLKGIGLDGYISCQTQRAFFPTGLGMMVMARTLWNAELDFEAIAQDYFRSTFGPDGDQAYAYLSKLSELFDPPYIRGEKAQVDPEAARRFSQIPEVIEGFEPIIEGNLSLEDTCWAASWRYLKEHALFCKSLARAFAARASGNSELAAREWSTLKRMIQEREDQLQTVLDVWLMLRVLEGRLLAPLSK